MTLLTRSILKLARSSSSSVFFNMPRKVSMPMGHQSTGVISRSFTTKHTDLHLGEPVIEEVKSEEPKEEEGKQHDGKRERSFTAKVVDGVLAGVVGYFVVKIGVFLLDFPPICQIVTTLAEQSPFLREHLGTPITRSLLWWGTVEENYAKISIDVTGPKGAARIDAKALRNSDGSWEVLYLYGALPQFDMRLTDLLPPSQTVNIMPYIPAADDPNAAHHLRGAPAIGVSMVPVAAPTEAAASPAVPTPKE